MSMSLLFPMSLFPLFLISPDPHKSIPSSPHPTPPPAPSPPPLLVYSRHKTLPPPVVFVPSTDPLAFDDSDLANCKYPLCIRK